MTVEGASHQLFRKSLELIQPFAHSVPLCKFLSVALHILVEVFHDDSFQALALLMSSCGAMTTSAPLSIACDLAARFLEFLPKHEAGECRKISTTHLAHEYVHRTSRLLKKCGSHKCPPGLKSLQAPSTSHKGARTELCLSTDCKSALPLPSTPRLLQRFYFTQQTQCGPLERTRVTDGTRTYPPIYPDTGVSLMSLSVRGLLLLEEDGETHVTRDCLCCPMPMTGFPVTNFTLSLAALQMKLP